MPLSPTELHEEELVQLRRLAQSQGWALFSTRVLKRVASSEREKARCLREGQTDAAIRLQARIDGLKESLDLLQQAMDGIAEDLQPKEPVGSYA